MKSIISKIVVHVILLTLSYSVIAQIDTCIFGIKKHVFKSTCLNEEREFWISLLMHYDTAKAYPVLYVLDAEWRFDLIRPIAYDMAGNKKIPHHIIVGIPHVDWKFKRGVDLTFSHSRIEYNGEKVDSTVYNKKNSGGGMLFFKYINEELIPEVDKHYASNGVNILVGHSYGGYFASYILPMDHAFSAFQIYDPSIWFSNGETTNRIIQKLTKEYLTNIFIAFQPVPEFHSGKIKEMITVLSGFKNIKLGVISYPGETHNSMFMDSFIDGMKYLYSNFQKEKTPWKN